MAPVMVGDSTRWVWLVAVGWERVVLVKVGDLPGREVARRPAGVRAAIVVQASRRQSQGGKTSTPERKRVMTVGAKGGREVD